MAELIFPDGVVSYDVHGHGPPLVILRGLARSVSHWLGYERQLARDFTVVTMDLRGVGKTTRPWSVTTSIYDTADDLVAVLDAAGIERAHVLGVSLGGMVTLAAGIKHPKRCASLIAVNTSIAGARTLRLSLPAAKVLLAALYQPLAENHADLVDILVGGACPPARKAEVAEAYVAIAKAETLYGKTALRQLLAASRFLPIKRLKTLAVPALIVYGTEDRFVPTINSRKLVQYIPQATLTPIHGGGHELTLDKGDELAAVVKDWVARRP